MKHLVILAGSVRRSQIVDIDEGLLSGGKARWLTPVVSDTTRTFEIAQAQFHTGVASRQIERTVPDRWRQIVRHRINSLDGNARRSRWAVY